MVVKRTGTCLAEYGELAVDHASLNAHDHARSAELRRGQPVFAVCGILQSERAIGNREPRAVLRQRTRLVQRERPLVQHNGSLERIAGARKVEVKVLLPGVHGETAAAIDIARETDRADDVVESAKERQVIC